MPQNPDRDLTLPGVTNFRALGSYPSLGGSSARWRNCRHDGLNAQETVDDLEAALEQFRLIAGDLAAEAAQE